MELSEVVNWISYALFTVGGLMMCAAAAGLVPGDTGERANHIVAAALFYPWLGLQVLGLALQIAILVGGLIWAAACISGLA